MPDQLITLRIAHEHASFADYRLRDAITTVIKQLEADFDEVALEVSDQTNVALKELQELIDEIEAPRRPKPVVDLVEIEEVVAREVPPVLNDGEYFRVVEPEEFVRKVHVVSEDELEEV